YVLAFNHRATDLGDGCMAPEGPILMDLRWSALDREGVVVPAGAVCRLPFWILAWSCFANGGSPGLCLCAVIRGLGETDESNCGGRSSHGGSLPWTGTFSGSTARLFLSAACPL